MPYRYFWNFFLLCIITQKHVRLAFDLCLAMLLKATALEHIFLRFSPPSPLCKPLLFFRRSFKVVFKTKYVSSSIVIT